jgi:hypothetical protein
MNNYSVTQIAKELSQKKVLKKKKRRKTNKQTNWIGAELF